MALSTAPRRITPRQARTLMRQNPNTIILDVRTRQEYNTVRIPGSMLLPSDTIRTHAYRALPDKNALILVHCKSGGRSREAANTLTYMGYTNVCDFGGIESWPYETE